MRRHLKYVISFSLVVLFLVACNAKSPTNPLENAPSLNLPASFQTIEPTYTPPNTAVFVLPPPETQPSPLPPTDTPPVVAIETVTPTSSFPESNFFVKVRGSRVAYFDVGTGRVCAMDAGGSTTICTPSDQPLAPTALSWSPSGDRLVIDDGNTSLKIWTLGGGVFPFREAGSGATIIDPAWSPDGQFIAYASDQFGRKAGETVLYDIFIAKLDGSAPRYMTTAKAADNWFPRWSPDGKWLAYLSAPILKYPDGTTRTSVYQVTLLEVANPTRPFALISGEAYELRPGSSLEWSPQGTQIAFAGQRLFVMNADGSGAHQVGGTDYGYTAHLTWLPDGRSLLIGDRLVDSLSGDWTKLSLTYDPALARWVFPVNQAALDPFPAPNCAEGWTKLFVGSTAIVAGSPDDPPNVVRSGPGKANEIIYQIYPQIIVKVVGGPVCADGLVYWKIEYARIPGGSGWTAEGDRTNYWLNRLTP